MWVASFSLQGSFQNATDECLGLRRSRRKMNRESFTAIRHCAYDLTIERTGKLFALVARKPYFQAAENRDGPFQTDLRPFERQSRQTSLECFAIELASLRNQISDGNFLAQRDEFLF